MSFNVRGSFRDLGTENAWHRRAEMNVATVARQAPEAVGFQEFQWGNRRTYRRLLPDYKEIPGPRYGNAPPFDYNAILFDPGRLEVLDTGGFWLSETPERHSRSWQTRVARSANWALFRSRQTDLVFLHLNTHLDHASRPARLEGARLILRRLPEIAARRPGDPPVVVTGDFNCRPGSPPYEVLVGGGYADTYLAAGNEDAPDANTFHNFKGANYRDARRAKRPRRIDWILLRDPRRLLHPSSHEILRDHEDGRCPSDHYGILADFLPVIGESR
jgi:endonuclease/exonuclease/phosphatase family metal-dependent hydrolase